MARVTIPEFAIRPDVVIVAGAGALPAQLALSARASGAHVGIVTVAGTTDGDYSAFDSVSVRFGEVGRLRTLLRAAKADVVLSGQFKRPDYAAVAWDWGIVPILARVLRTGFGGDDAALRIISSIMDDWGVRMVGPSDIAPDLVAATGQIAGGKPNNQDRADIKCGFDVISATAPFDVGQCVVVHQGRVLAVEAAEGTDAMLERCADLRRSGRLRSRGRAGVLIKRAKPGQDLRSDMPVIGLETIRRAEAAELRGIAVEAGRVLIADKAEVMSYVQRTGLFLVGVDNTTET
ncbi:MAG: UDP-2,3-diacylglucosamine diphosphatase LpxI [Pseudomonadota bacterium]